MVTRNSAFLDNILKSQPRYTVDSEGGYEDDYNPQPYGSSSSTASPFGGNAYGNGGSQGHVLGRSAGQTGTNSTGQVAFTGDSTYMDQVNAINNARANSMANFNAQRQQATQQYDNSRQDLNRQSGVDQYNMVNDFASRGVLNSGLYAKSEDDRAADVTRRQQAMAMALQGQLGGFDSQQAQFNSESELALNRAKADAAARQAAKIGIG